METIGSFIIIKNEAHWIRAHLNCWLPYLDEMVFLDGNSSDGTLEILKSFQKHDEYGTKILIVEDRDPKDLQDDYVRIFNEALRALKTDLAIFLHPDMISNNPQVLREFVDQSEGAISAFSRMRSFAGDPGEPALEIVKGRSDRWKNIYRLNNPDLGAHYHGWYGADNEDVYFKEITGASHNTYARYFDRYPYEVLDSRLEILHFSDVRTYQRRYERMKKSLLNQNVREDFAEETAREHPRVTLKPNPSITLSDGEGFTFVPYSGHVPYEKEAACHA